jgi:hypothetical protein
LQLIRNCINLPAMTYPHRPGAAAAAPSERLLLTALQAWAGAGGSEPVRPEELARVIAWRTSARVAAVFTAWLHAIEAARVRPIEAQCPGCGGPSTDVQRLVVACGIAPVDAALGERLIEPLVSDAHAVMVLGRFLNTALAAAGWPLPARLCGPCAAGPSPGAVLH